MFNIIKFIEKHFPKCIFCSSRLLVENCDLKIDGTTYHWNLCLDS